jgi:hypothetical protein
VIEYVPFYVCLAFAIRRDRGVRGRVRLPTVGGLRAEYYPARLDRRALFSLPILLFALALYSILVLQCFIRVTCPIHLFIQSKAIEPSTYPITRLLV